MPLLLAAGIPLWVKPFVPAAGIVWLFLLPVTIKAAFAPGRRLVLFLAAVSFAAVATVGLAKPAVASSFHKLLLALAMMTLATITYLWLLDRIPRPQWGRALGMLFFGAAVAARVFYQPGAGYSLWKYAIAWPVTGLVVCVADSMWHRDHKARAMGLCVALAVLLLLTSSRNLATMVVVAIIAAACARSMAHRRGTARSNRFRVVLGAAGGVLVVSSAIASGLLGSELQSKWQAQGGNPIAVVADGRPELAFSVAALSADPVGGYGIGVPLPDRPLSQAAEASLVRLSRGDQQDLLARIADSQVNVHSFIMDLWLQATILAALGPISMWFVALRSFVGSAPGFFGPLPFFAAAALVWDLLFSPLTYFSNVYWGVLMAVLLAARRTDAVSPLAMSADS